VEELRYEYMDYFYEDFSESLSKMMSVSCHIEATWENMLREKFRIIIV